MLAISPFGYLFDYVLLLALYAAVIALAWCFFRHFPRKRLRLRLVLGNVAVLVCLLGTAAMVAETYLRFFSIATEGYGLSLPARRWFALYVDLNSVGCRDREWERESDRYRIAFVGDSYVYGWGIERPEDRITGRLAARFDSVRPGAVEVMNVARPAWNTGDELQPVVDCIERYGVDEVVLGYLPNDIEGAIPVTPDFNPTHPPESDWFNPDGSCLLDYLHRRLILPSDPLVRGYFPWLMNGFADEAIWRKHQQQLGALVNACRDRGVPFRVALMPFLLPADAEFDAAGIHDMLRRFFEANGVEVVDLRGAIAGREPASLTVNSADAHPNERAHDLFAEAVWAAFYQGRVPAAP